LRSQSTHTHTHTYRHTHTQTCGGGTCCAARAHTHTHTHTCGGGTCCAAKARQSKSLPWEDLADRACIHVVHVQRTHARTHARTHTRTCVLTYVNTRIHTRAGGTHAHQPVVPDVKITVCGSSRRRAHTVMSASGASSQKQSSKHCTASPFLRAASRSEEALGDECATNTWRRLGTRPAMAMRSTRCSVDPSQTTHVAPVFCSTASIVGTLHASDTGVDVRPAQRQAKSARNHGTSLPPQMPTRAPGAPAAAASRTASCRESAKTEAYESQRNASDPGSRAPRHGRSLYCSNAAANASARDSGRPSAACRGASQSQRSSPVWPSKKSRGSPSADHRGPPAVHQRSMRCAVRIGRLYYNAW